MSTDIWVWIMGLSMLCIFSFLIRENPFYRFCEHVFVGLAAGYGLGVAYKNLLNKAWAPITTGGIYILIIPVVFGLLSYARFAKPFAWMARYPIAFTAGSGAGLAIYAALRSTLVPQIKANIVPLWVSGDAAATVKNLYCAIGVLLIMLYFFFSREHKGPLRQAASVGRLLLMVTFGVSFGNVVMGRMALLLGAVRNILGDWLGVL